MRIFNYTVSEGDPLKTLHALEREGPLMHTHEIMIQAKRCAFDRADLPSTMERVDPLEQDRPAVWPAKH